MAGLRKLYDATLDDKENPEALQDLILTKPTYKPREKVYHVLSDEMRKLIDEELEKNAKKTALGQRKQLKKVQDIHNNLCKAGYLCGIGRLNWTAQPGNASSSRNMYLVNASNMTGVR
ncbi:MAG: hypothetical protein KBS72_07375 [Bacteroidales bacterium]|nr:hypothetical protein [Candidatus Cacconaster scatequi]